MSKVSENTLPSAWHTVDFQQELVSLSLQSGCPLLFPTSNLFAWDAIYLHLSIHLDVFLFLDDVLGHFC